MQDQFKNLSPGQDAPEDLKKEVFNTIDTLNLFSEIMDLFTVKFPNSKGQIISAATDREHLKGRSNGQSPKEDHQSDSSKDNSDQK